eukprot:Hpha_TRINITY_DN15996_c1_g2::TRINITY_DN15996_c1_g2_i1::g.74403::m.74403
MASVLVVGASGRTGVRTVQELLSRGVEVRALVRKPESLPEAVRADPKCRVVQGTILEMSDDAIAAAVDGCTGVVSCLGHNMSFKGLYLDNRRLVTESGRRLVRAVERLRPSRPVRFVIHNTVGCSNPVQPDRPRGCFEGCVIGLIKCAIPPFADSAASVAYWGHEIGAKNPYVDWVVVRPDTLLETERSEYTVHEQLQGGLFNPGKSTMWNIAHFYGELLTNDATWAQWRHKYPTILDTPEPVQKGNKKD